MKSKYTDELVNKICTLISSTNKGMKEICEHPDINIGYTTHTKWLSTNAEYRDKYAKAKQQQAEHLANEIINISDNTSSDYVDGEYGKVGNSTAVQRSKLMIDSRKWLLSKLLPKKYGDKIEVDNKGKIDNNLTVTIIRNKKEKED